MKLGLWNRLESLDVAEAPNRLETLEGRPRHKLGAQKEVMAPETLGAVAL